MSRTLSAVCTIAFLLASATTYGDIVIYNVPNTSMVVRMQGSTKVNPGRTVTFIHPKFGKLIFALERAKIFKTETTATMARRRLAKAKNKGEVDAILDAGKWALHKGELKVFYEAAAEAWKVNPNHERVVPLVRLQQKIRADLGPHDKQVAEIQTFLKNKRGMKVEVSKHFVLMHDTDDEPVGRSRKSRAKQRLELLEVVYESYLNKFYSEGIELVVPKERLKVVLFADHKDYLAFVRLLSPSLKSTAGFFTRKENISVFFDQGTHDSFKPLIELDKVLQEQAKIAKKRPSPRTRDLVRLSQTISMLSKLSQANSDVEVVSHETTHQMAGNTGVMPPDCPMPRWAAEGLATYFESPKEAAWSGIGAVNQQRLERYKILARDTRRSSIENIITDHIFIDARDHEAVLHSYGQAWALTHFLMEKHFDKLISWYAKIAKMKTKKGLTTQIYMDAFKECFGDDLPSLNNEWRAYMRTLRTDIEVITGE